MLWSRSCLTIAVEEGGRLMPSHHHPFHYHHLNFKLDEDLDTVYNQEDNCMSCYRKHVQLANCVKIYIYIYIQSPEDAYQEENDSSMSIIFTLRSLLPCSFLCVINDLTDIHRNSIPSYRTRCSCWGIRMVRLEQNANEPTPKYWSQTFLISRFDRSWLRLSCPSLNSGDCQ